ncbi:MAG: acyl-CoA dehydrogenase [Pseudomonadota bacterium]
MPEYAAPVRELKFVLDEIADLPALAAYPTFSEATDELVTAVLDEAARLANDVIAPLNAVGDTHGVKLGEDGVVAAPGFVDAYAGHRDSGWLSLAIPAEHGGQGLPFALHIAVSEMWNAANLSFALCPMLSMGAIEAVIKHGSDDIQARFLAELVDGSTTGTMNLTEPQAGSDLAAVKTMAVPDGDAFRVTGQKIYITWGDHDLTPNILHMVLARTPDAPPGVRGLSLFLVPKRLPNGEVNDVKTLSVEHKLGIHASPTCVLSFGDSGNGSVGYLIGELNQGLACMFTMMNHARLEVGLEGVGLCDRALQAARYYANERRQGHQPGIDGQAPIIEHADVRRMLLTMRGLAEAGRAMTIYAGAALDRALYSDDERDAATWQQRLELLTPIVKAWCTEVAQEATSLGVQVHGGMGYVEETGVAQYLRDARITPIYEGTNGIQAADFAGRKFLRDGGAAFAALAADIETTCSELAAADLGESARALETYLGLLKDAARAVRETASTPEHTGAQAYDFMMATGYLVGGWLMARQLLVAARHTGDNDAFLAGKRISTRFYLSSLLPRVAAHCAAVTADDNVAANAAPEFV